jgi:hypothetical protein
MTETNKDAGNNGDSNKNNAPETRDVDWVDGKKFTLPKDVADAVIGIRDQYKELSRKRDAEEARAKAAEEKARKETERAAAIEAAKSGDIEKLKSEWTQPLTDELNQTKARLIKNELQATLASRGDVVQKSIGDVVDSLSGKVKFVMDKDGVVKAEDGKTVKDHVDSYLKERDYLLIAKTTTGTGAAGTGNIGKQVVDNTAKMTPQERLEAAYKADKKA